MAVILHIETSGTTCSAALSAEGMILAHREDFGGRNHAALISDYVKHCLDHAASHEMELQAVAVSIGPGSYTGLRIGLSEAKGLAYALGVPLIGVHTLELMATTAMFEAAADDPDTIFIPMVDARRMEVYTAAYDYSLNSIVEPQAMILEKDSLATERASGRPLVFFGSGAAKAQPLFAGDSAARYVEGIEPLATGMLALAEKAWANRQFIDIAYSTPVYLKDFQATQPKHKVL